MPGSKTWVRKDKLGVDVWLMEVYLGAKPDGTPDRRKRTFHGSPSACDRAVTLFFAEEYKKQQRKEMAASRMTVAEWAEEWLEILRKNDRSANTLRSYRELLYNRILPGMGDTQLSELSPRQIQNWLEQMEHQRRLPRKRKKPAVSQDSKETEKAPQEPPLSPSSIQRHFAVLRAMLQEAVYRHRIPSNPAKAVRAPGAASPEAAAYTNDALGPVLAALKSYDTMFRALVVLALTTGARRGELIGLEWQHIDLAAATMTIEQGAIYAPGVGQIVKRPKTRRSVRPLPLPPEAVAVLTVWKAEQATQRDAKGAEWQGGDYIFTTQHGSWITLDYANRKLSRFLTKHKLPKIKLHGLRHTVATHLLANGLPLADASAHLGHSQTSTTLNIYTHALKANQSRAADILQSAFFPSKIPSTDKQMIENEHELQENHDSL